MQSTQTDSKTGEPSNTVEVLLKHSGVENRIIGTPGSVIRELLAYFSKVYPSLELFSRIILTVDDTEFLQASAGLLAVCSEGLVILRDITGLKDKELMLVHLAGSRLLYLMGNRDADSISLEQLTRATGRATGTVAGRLSELTNDQLVERIGKGAYRLTTMGARTVMRSIIPRAMQFPER
ncbi:MAG TPA: hypothetical protein VFE98_00885 [Candidatus Bathyarchaeia archaeon]|nr:hypothetical protein [Candidatus Bathyarchaeia archaeon]